MHRQDGNDGARARFARIRAAYDDDANHLEGMHVADAARAAVPERRVRW